MRFLCLLAVSLLIAVVVSHTTNTTKNTVGDCYCAGGSINLFGYETVPTANTGAGCIGGCGGTPYQAHTDSSTIQILSVWCGGESNGFRAIYIQMFNGQQFTQGVIPASGPDASITFVPGETIVGDITIDGNGIGTRAGYLAFQTSANQKFSVGSQHTPYYFNSGNSFLTGFFGQSDTEVEQLGIFMMKSIKTGSLQNIQYPTLSSYTVGLAPQIYQTNLCNAGTDPQTQTATFTTTIGESHTWSVSVSFTIGASISVSAGVPEVASVEEKFEWSVSATSDYSLSTDTTSSKTQCFPVNVGGRTKINATFSWWDSQCDVPYNATLLYTFTDGTSYEFSVSDTYSGAYITNSIGNYDSTPLQTGEGCDSASVKSQDCDSLHQVNATLIKSNVK